MLMPDVPQFSSSTSTTCYEFWWRMMELVATSMASIHTHLEWV
nr:hypothetical protein [uncultured Dyadobacter sp.]